MFRHRAKLILISSILVSLLLAINLLAEAQNNDGPTLAPPSPTPQPPTPTPAPAPTPAPTPIGPTCTILTSKPVPELGNYIFKSCLVAQFAAYFEIAPGKYVELNKGVTDQTSSSCENANTSNPNPKLVINFPCASLNFNIARTNDSKTYVSDISGQYHLKDSNSTVTFSNTTAMFYTTQSGHYYRCNSEQPIKFGDKGELMLSQFALEAYRDTSGTDFYQIPEYCLLDSPPVSDLVRIGVGVCLVALVAIVLIAYFIGRRRWSERSTYESV